MAKASRKSRSGAATTPTAPLAGLAKHLNTRVDDLRRIVPQALGSWDSSAIHQSRVATRRLKAAIDLLEPVLPPGRRQQRFGRTLKRLRRALGPLRDTDVMLEHCQDLRTQTKQSAAIDWLTSVLEARREKLRRECAREYPLKVVLDGLGAWWGLEQEVAEAEHAVQSLLRQAAPAQLAAFTDRADRLIRAREESPSMFVTTEAQADDDVHALRIAGKHLRYTLELAEPAGYEIPPTVFRAFKKLQESLGAWHDFVVIGETSLREAIRAELPAHHGGLYGDVLELAHFLWKRSDRHLDRFARLWRANGPTIAEQISKALELDATAEPTCAAPAVEIDLEVNEPTSAVS